MKRKVISIKRRMYMFGFGIALVVALSTTTAVYALKTDTYKYPNGYEMNYSLHNANALWRKAAVATTSTENEAVAFVSIFSYKNGVVTNNANKQQDSYVHLELNGNGGSTYKSIHALKYPDGTPIGVTKKLDE